MADIPVTVTNLRLRSGGTTSRGIAGEAMTGGQSVYLKSSDAKWYKAKNDTSENASASGVNVFNADSGDDILIINSGDLAFGSVLTQGETYVVSATAGGIAPIGDLASGKYVTHLGVAKNATTLAVKPNPTGVTKP